MTKVITDSDQPDIWPGELDIDYQRTDSAPLSFKVPGNRPISETIVIQNSSGAAFNVNLGVSSSVFHDSVNGWYTSFSVPASSSKTLVHTGFGVWEVS